jgi:hypothetical protein
MDKEEHWYKSYWRPTACYAYIFICLFDFCLAPIGLAIFCGMFGVPYITWTPLTLQGSGLFHLAFGSICGISALTRGQEKIAAVKAEGT